MKKAGLISPRTVIDSGFNLKMGGDLMMKLMELVHGFTGSWGLAIITLTLIVRLLLHP
jgi:membrane protein insertase Oxa1/YidC/SpoIIIJ